MCFLAGTACCCAGQACCSASCCICKACGVSPKNFPRVAYVLNSVFWICIAYVCIYTMGYIFDKVPWLECSDASGGKNACFGTSAIVRMSFSLLIFHVIILIALIPRMTCSAAFHDGCWCVKYLMTLGIFIVTFFIDNNFFRGYT